jgi:hypothetical protein
MGKSDTILSSLKFISLSVRDTLSSKFFPA